MIERTNKPVCLEIFKAKDIKNTNGSSLCRLGLIDGSIHLAYYPNEESSINTFNKGITNIGGLTVT